MIKKFILILLLAFTLNLGVQSSRLMSNTSRHIIENIIEKNFTKDNEEFIKEVEKKRFSEMVRLYTNILQTNKNFTYYNTS
jgi:membrane associated rhomboid family serine protease